MDQPFLDGEKVYLRGLRRDDLTGAYHAWLDDPEVTRYLETGRWPNTPEAMARFYDQHANSRDHAVFAVCEKASGRHVGNVKLGPIHWVHRFAEWGILLGAKDCWGRGYGTEAARLSLGHAFDRLNLHKVILGVAAPHKAAIASYQKVGFREEGRIAELLFIDGAYHDKVLMGVTKAQFEAATKRPRGGTRA